MVSRDLNLTESVKPVHLPAARGDLASLQARQDRDFLVLGWGRTRHAGMYRTGRLGAGLCLRPHSHMHVQLTKTENSVVLKKAYLKKCSGYKNTLIREFVRDNNLGSNIFTVFSCR